jgi:hypothetical protein
MAFCGQCGLLLNTNITRCPRCGTEIDPYAATPGIPTNDNAATIIAQTDNSRPGGAFATPPPLAAEIPAHDATKAVYYTAPDASTLPEPNAARPGNLQNENSYPTPGVFEPGFPQSGSTYTTPSDPSYNALPAGYNQGPGPGMYQPGAFPITNPGYPPPYTPPPARKTHRGLIAIIIVLIVALVVVSGLLFAVGSHRLTGLFGVQNTPLVQPTPTTPSIPTATPANTTPQATATPSPTQQTTTTTVPTQQAQATVQLYYNDINSQDYQDAYNLWVNYPDNYTHFKQGFAHTHHDAITLGDAVAQVDGTIQVDLTVQATEDASGGGTQISTYTGYYTVGQQADGSWKIINGQLG